MLIPVSPHPNVSRGLRQAIRWALAVLITDWVTKAIAILWVGGLSHVPDASSLEAADLSSLPDGAWPSLFVIRHEVPGGHTIAYVVHLTLFILALLVATLVLAFLFRGPMRRWLPVLAGVYSGAALANGLEVAAMHGATDWIGFNLHAFWSFFDTCGSCNLADLAIWAVVLSFGLLLWAELMVLFGKIFMVSSKTLATPS